jgi:hypothetical protein
VLPSIDLRIQNLVKALQQVVLPAIPPQQRLARDQASLVIGHLNMIAAQWKSALKFESQSLDGLLGLAEKLLAARDVGMTANLRARLGAEIGLCKGIDRSDGAAIEAGNVRLGKLVDELIRADDTQQPIPPELMQLVFEYGARQAWRERTWFQGNMLDPGRAELPSIAQMLAE